MGKLLVLIIEVENIDVKMLRDLGCLKLIKRNWFGNSCVNGK